ncbi:MAG: hypothetical protein ACLSHG_08630 [Oscillospiraceae bacterium]
MKSIYFKNFAATAVMVMFSFLILGTAFVVPRPQLCHQRIPRQHGLQRRGGQPRCAGASCATVSSRTGTCVWSSAPCTSTGNHIFITDIDGTIVSTRR